MVLSRGPMGHSGIAQLHKTSERLLPKSFWQAKALSALIYRDIQFGALSLLPGLVKDLRVLGWTEKAGLMSASTTVSPIRKPTYTVYVDVLSFIGIFIGLPETVFFSTM